MGGKGVSVGAVEPAGGTNWAVTSVPGAMLGVCNGFALALEAPGSVGNGGNVLKSGKGGSPPGTAGGIGGIGPGALAGANAGSLGNIGCAPTLASGCPAALNG
jgi:hypothetical protein